MNPNEHKVSCPSKERADITRVEVVASLRMTYTIFNNLSLSNIRLDDACVAGQT